MSKFIELGAEEKIKTSELFGKAKNEFSKFEETQNKTTVQNVQIKKEKTKNGSN